VSNYELIYIVNPAINEEILPETINKVNDIVNKAGGTVVETTQWGRKKLAYPLRKQTEGSYIYSKVQTEAAALKRIDSVLKMDEDILRHLIVRTGK
jgi:small subunit ribosomal protein S6